MSSRLKVEQIDRYCSSIRLCPQIYCIMFLQIQDDHFNKQFLLRIDYKAAKEVIQKNVKNLVSEQIFARWQQFICFLTFNYYR